MAKKRRNTKGKIVSAAWELFYRQGYAETTVDEIIELSGTSKGSFYHYFKSKDELVGSLAYLFDEKYEELTAEVDPAMGSWDRLLFLNRELFTMIDNSIPRELLAQLYASQLLVKGEKELLDRQRLYFRLLRSIAEQGLRSGEFDPALSAEEIVRIYALCERALLYDWCICEGSYALPDYSARLLPMLLSRLRAPGAV